MPAEAELSLPISAPNALFFHKARIPMASRLRSSRNRVRMSRTVCRHIRRNTLTIRCIHGCRTGRKLHHSVQSFLKNKNSDTQYSVQFSSRQLEHFHTRFCEPFAHGIHEAEPGVGAPNESGQVRHAAMEDAPVRL